MTFAGAPFAESTLAGVAGAGVSLAPPSPPDTGGPPATTVVSPFIVELDGLAVTPRVNSVRIDAELGRQGEASFELQNLAVLPAIGQPVRILYFKQVIFAGAIDRFEIESEPSQSMTVVSCACTDHSYLLVRRKIKQRFTNQTIFQIATTLANSELLADGVTVGTVEVSVPIPIADADWVSIHQFLSDLAMSVGAIFYIDVEKKMQFISTGAISSVTPLTASAIEQCTVRFDRETYRNQQTTTVTGTPSVDGQKALTVELTRSNNEQIIERNAVEHSTGIYNEHVAVTHPSSNDATQLAKLAQAYNKISLGLSGSLRRSLSVRTRQYGYAAGQYVEVTLDVLGVSGTWVIQRMRLTEESGLFLITSLDLNQSALIRRPQELWLDVVRTGTVSVLPPSSVYTQAFTSMTPGGGSWTVPAGVTEAQVTLFGGGGGGGGGARSEWPGYGGVNTANGSDGGSGGLSISVLAVTPGEILTYFVGSGGIGGAGQYRFESLTDALGVSGTNGSTSWVARSGSVRVGQADGGNGGIGGVANARLQYANTLPAGRDGSGLYGNVVTTGGAGNRGVGGTGFNNAAGTNAANGRIVIEW